MIRNFARARATRAYAGWRSFWHDLRLRRRRVWARGGRAYLELRELAPEEQRVFAEAARRDLEALPGISWVRLNGVLERLVVAYDEARWQEPLDLVRRVEEVEERLGLHTRPFGLDTPEHPGDLEPMVRTGVTLVADALGLGLGVALRVVRSKPEPAEVELATLASALQHIPRLRKAVERRMGWAATDLTLGLLSPLASGLVRGWSSPVVDAVSRTLDVRELLARRDCWRRLEPDLGGPAAHGGCLRPVVVQRPVPLRRGPIERYAERASLASIGGFGFGLVATQRMESAAASLAGGVPKPGRVGREAFGAWLGVRLARLDMLVLHPHALRRLDRIDWLAVQASLLDASDPTARALVGAARRAGLRVAVLDDAEHVADWAAPDVRLPGRVGPEVALQSLQADGSGVLLVALDRCGGFALADLGVGVVRDGEAIAWDADVLARDGLRAALLLTEAVVAARATSWQSVQLAGVDAAASLLLSVTDLKPRTVRRIMLLSDVGAVLALGNAVRHARAVPDAAPALERSRPRWHALEGDEVLERLGSARDGLDEATAAARRAPLPAAPRRALTLLRAVGEELATPLTPILGGAAAVAAAVGSAADAALVGAVVGVNAVVGATQRLRVARALARLDRSERRAVRVRRAGRPGDVDVDAGDLVPGDVVRLRAGDAVSADCRILEAAGLEVDESGLTGESLPVSKDRGAREAAIVAERTSMLHAGTSIASGEVTAVVVAVGAATEARRPLEAGDRVERRSGVEARLDALMASTLPLAAGGGVALLGSSLLRGGSTREALGAAVSLGVAAVPESLPLLATIAQLAAARRLSTRGVLVRDPRSIEALGRVDVLCADKTGTLTEGRIRLAVVDQGDGAPGRVDAGASLEPRARDVIAAGLRACPVSSADQPLAHLTDRALVAGAEALGVTTRDGVSGWTRVDELPFEPARGYHAVVGRTHAPGGEGELLCLKGAPEVVLERCDRLRTPSGDVALDAEGRRRLAERAGALARRGLRVLAVAQGPANGWRATGDAPMRGLMLEGLLGFADPVRATARQAVDALHRAGVRLLMATGDHPSTAEAIAAELGVLDHGAVLTGPELDALDDAALEERLDATTVFARVTPRQKARVVAALRRRGRVVAMAGDGANDAPAIREADVGIALGAASTGAAREAADLVVTDDRLETIVDAVLEGRALWRSVRDAVAILVGGNLGEIGFTVLGGLVSGEPPLGARQLLLVNLLTDALPALSVAISPPGRASPEQLSAEGPEASLGAALTRDLTWRAALTTAAAWSGWLPARLTGSRERASTVGLLALVGAQLGQTLVAGGREPRVLLSTLGSLGLLLLVVETPGPSQFFGCRPVGPIGLLQAGAAASAATGAALVLPGALDRARVAGEWFGARERLERSEIARLFRESRLLTRLRRARSQRGAPARRFQVTDLFAPP